MRAMNEGNNRSESSWLIRLVLSYLRWKYGRNVGALKPPIGWHPDFHHPRFHKRLSYSIEYRIWRFDNGLFERYGQPMRDAWEESASRSPYDPVEELRKEVKRFKETNQFNPMLVTNFYVQAEIALRELDAARAEIEKLKANV